MACFDHVSVYLIHTLHYLKQVYTSEVCTNCLNMMLETKIIRLNNILQKVSFDRISMTGLKTQNSEQHTEFSYVRLITENWLFNFGFSKKNKQKKTLNFSASLVYRFGVSTLGEFVFLSRFHFYLMLIWYIFILYFI